MDLRIERCRSWLVDAIKSNVVIHITNANNITTTFNTFSTTNNNKKYNNNNNNNPSSTSLTTSMSDLSNQSNKIGNGIIGIRTQ